MRLFRFLTKALPRISTVICTRCWREAPKGQEIHHDDDCRYHPVTLFYQNRKRIDLLVDSAWERNR